MTIRTLVEADLPRIKEIDRAIFPPEEQYDDAAYQSMTQTELSVVAMDSNGQLVGYAFVQRPQDWPWLRESDLIAEPRIYPAARVRSIAVHPDYRRQGYARALLRFVTDKAVDLVDLLVDKENVGALTLYQSVGFEQAQPCPRDPPRLRLVLSRRNSTMARRGFLSVNGVRLAYAAFGGVGPPALLLHGLYGKATEWRSTGDWLMKSHEVFALDQRGHGESDKGLSDLSRGAQVDDAIAVIERLDRGPVLLMGQSMGGVTALLAAARRPDLVNRLIVIEATDHSKESASVSEPWFSRWPIPFPSLDEAKSFFRSQQANADVWVEVLQERDDGYWPEFLADDMKAAAFDIDNPYDYQEEWSSIRCPTLLVGGANGWLDQEIMREMASAVPNASYVCIEKAGHDVHLENPAALRSAVMSFLAKTK